MEHKISDTASNTTVIYMIYIIIGLFIGFLWVYVFTPPPLLIFKYPSLNSKSETYVDENGTCYKYNPVIIPYNL